MAHLDLFHNGVMVGVLVLDRVLDGDDVVATTGVDQVKQRSEGRSLATTSRTREQHQPLSPFRQLGQRRRQVQRFE